MDGYVFSVTSCFMHLLLSYGQTHSYSGTKVNTAYISLLSTINFWKTVGPSDIRQYCHNLLVDAGMYATDIVLAVEFQTV